MTTEEAAATATAHTTQQETPPAANLPGPAETEPQATTTAQARAAEAALKAPVAEVGDSGPTILQLAREAQLPLDAEDWELSEEGLPESSTLLGSKALLEDYPEDEANSKKPKKQNNGKGKKSKPKA